VYPTETQVIVIFLALAVPTTFPMFGAFDALDDQNIQEVVKNSLVAVAMTLALMGLSAWGFTLSDYSAAYIMAIVLGEMAVASFTTFLIASYLWRKQKICKTEMY
jgi:glycine/D-amino acid oxidase-like deaminating enzyme